MVNFIRWVEFRIMKIVNFNSEEDFKKNIGPYVDENEGITAEGLSRRTKIPLLLAISKLEVSNIFEKFLKFFVVGIRERKSDYWWFNWRKEIFPQFYSLIFIIIRYEYKERVYYCIP